MGRRPPVVFVLLLFVLFVASESTGEAEQKLEEEEFTEELLFRPLPDRKVLSHFHFVNRVPPTNIYGHHHRLFPKAIYQLVHKYRIRELELSFTQGRWNYERWGGFDPIASSNVKPTGVELWAAFDVPPHLVDAYWKNLTHTLSGLFCASINFLESSTTYSAPDWSFRSVSGNLRYGTLPREAVCTENLTPWLKLLPCRDKAGLSSLMDRPSIYRGFYHSQRLRLTSGDFDPGALGDGIVLEQTLTIVLQPDVLGTGVAFSSGGELQPSWSMSSLFGRTIDGKCELAKSSDVYVQLEGSLVSNLKDTWRDERNKDGAVPSENSWTDSNYFAFSVSPDRVMKEANSMFEGQSILYGFTIKDYHSKSFDLGFRWKLPVTWSCRKAPLHARRFLMGSGNAKGAIAVSLQSTEWNQGLQKAGRNEERCSLRVEVFQVVPWYIKVYYHTTKIFVDGKLQFQGDIVEKMHISPSEDKVSPGVMELILRLPCDIKSASLTLEFDKGFLHIDEYPPDANQGFDIPSAVVSFPDFQTSSLFIQDKTLNKSPMISKMQEETKVVSYTEVLLVPLTTPDFSMPYNVITITCTVFALYFGSLLNALRRRPGEEERLLKAKASEKTGKLPLLLSKLLAKLRGRPWEPPQSTPSSSSPKIISTKLILKIILMAAIAVGWQYYSTME